MWRMVGGTFGVAVMGALIIGLGKSKLDDLLPALPNGRRQDLAETLGAGGAHAGGQVGDAVQHGLRLRAERRPADRRRHHPPRRCSWRGC